MRLFGLIALPCAVFALASAATAAARGCVFVVSPNGTVRCLAQQ